MPLADLPPELLMQILEYVGSRCFLETTKLLTVSRDWFTYARAVRVMDLKMSQRSMQRLLSSPNAEAVLSLVKANLKRLDLNLVGFEDWGTLPDRMFQDISNWNDQDDAKVVAKWTHRLNHNLGQLAAVIKDAPNLRMFRMHAASEHHPVLHNLPRRDYLYTNTIRSLIDVKMLTMLDLDTVGTRLVSPPNDHDFHVCERIGSLLDTLRSVRLRLRNICTDVLKPRGSAALSLNRVVINLSLYEANAPSIMSASHATPCNSTHESFLELQVALERQAQTLVNSMTSPQLFRILTHSVVQLKLQSFDVLTGKYMTLAEGSAWEDDGNEAEDLNWDADSDISSLSWDT